MRRWNLLRCWVVGKMGRKGEVPAGQTLVEKREERFRALTENTNPDGVDVGDDLRCTLKSAIDSGRRQLILTRLITTARAPAALKQESVCAFVGG